MIILKTLPIFKEPMISGINKSAINKERDPVTAKTSIIKKNWKFDVISHLSLSLYNKINIDFMLLDGIQQG